MSPVAPQLGATKELISFIQHLPFVIMQWQTVTCFSWEHVWLHHGSCGWRWRARCRPADTPADTDTADTRPQCTLGSVGSTITSLTPLTLHLRALQTIGHKCAVICMCNTIQQHIMLRMKSSSWISYTNVEDHFHYTLYLVPLCKVFSVVIKAPGNGRIFFICLFC